MSRPGWVPGSHTKNNRPKQCWVSPLVAEHDLDPMEIRHRRQGNSIPIGTTGGERLEFAFGTTHFVRESNGRRKNTHTHRHGTRARRMWGKKNPNNQTSHTSTAEIENFGPHRASAPAWRWQPVETSRTRGFLYPLYVLFFSSFPLLAVAGVTQHPQSGTGFNHHFSPSNADDSRISRPSDAHGQAKTTSGNMRFSNSRMHPLAALR